MGRRTIKECVGCGKEFGALLIKVRTGRGKFCTRECYFAYRTQNKKADPRADIFYQKKHKYGLSKEQYLGLFASQNNACAICKATFSGSRAFVDHCHRSGKVRGLLCNKCNTMIGMANDDVVVLDQAIHYLNRH